MIFMNTYLISPKILENIDAAVVLFNRFYIWTKTVSVLMALSHSLQVDRDKREETGEKAYIEINQFTVKNQKLSLQK